MVASKTSFVIAAVAFSAATSVYAAPVQYNGGADLAARGFEDEDFQLAARFFDDEFEFEARDFDDELEARDFDEEEYLFAREQKTSSAFADDGDYDDDYPPPSSHFNSTKPSGKEGSVNGHPDPKDLHASSSPTYSTPSSGSPPGLNGHRVFAASNGTGVPPSKDGEYPHHHHHHHHKHHHKHHNHKHHHHKHHHKNVQSNLASPSRLATPEHKFAAPNGTPQQKSAGLTGSNSTHPASGFNNKLASGSGDYGKKQNMTMDREDDDDDYYETPVKHTQSPALKQRDFDEEDAILLARSLGLDDDYFLEARSFDDDMYEYY